MLRRNVNIFHSLICITALFCAATLFAEPIEAQKKKKSVGGNATVIATTATAAVADAGAAASEPYLSLEPCAKETETQIAELENAPDLGTQLTKLIHRTEDGNEWTRACAVYRLGEFGKAAQDALPVIIKLIRDETNGQVWNRVEDTLWKIPPDASLTLEQRIRLSKDPDIYRRLYAIYALSYFRPVPHSFQEKDTVKALIAATEDDDPTARWLAVMGIKQLGFYGADISTAIPALSGLLAGKKITAIQFVRTLVPIGEKALPAAPIVMEMLFEPKKYVNGADDNNVQSYSLFLTAAIALGNMGSSLLPLLEDESTKRPFAVIQVLSYLHHDKSLTILLRLAESPDPKIRKAAVTALPTLTSIGALRAIPVLMKLIDDPSKDVADSAFNRIGSIAQFTKDKSPELVKVIRETVVPKLIRKLGSKNNCYPMMTLGELGDDAKPALAKIAKLSKEGNYCADVALYRYGPAGHKYLTKEKLAEQEDARKSSLFDVSFPATRKPKTIKPKVDSPAKKSKATDG